jgi:uncharacterized protein (DUF1697 family)
MQRFVALLRGINVGGNRLIKMKDLKQMFIDMKFANVRTYIQSGNVVFDAKETDAVKLKSKIEKALAKALGYDVDIYLRSLEEMQAIIKYDAFKKMKAKPESKIYVAFLSDTPTKEQVKALEATSSETETFHVHKTELYLVSKRKPGDVFNIDTPVKKQLGMKNTARNWNTTQKLLALMEKEN